MELWCSILPYLAMECCVDDCFDRWYNHFHKKKRIEVCVCVCVCICVGVCMYLRDLDVIYFYREDEEQRINLKAMILSGILQTIVFLQEILIVVNVESGEHKWSAIFTPAYLFCLLCIGPCIWSCWRSRGVEVMILHITSCVT